MLSEIITLEMIVENLLWPVVFLFDKCGELIAELLIIDYLTSPKFITRIIVMGLPVLGVYIGNRTEKDILTLVSIAVAAIGLVNIVFI